MYFYLASHSPTRPHVPSRPYPRLYRGPLTRARKFSIKMDVSAERGYFNDVGIQVDVSGL
jgi:hypothetical protein